MGCLLMVNIKPNGRNAENMKVYTTEGPQILKKYGGHHIAFGGKPQALEGEFPWPLVVISEWENREAALAFWNSPEYTALRKYREDTGDYQIYLVDTK
jgi:uncharacterized protein (DUF1330 family)